MAAKQMITIRTEMHGHDLRTKFLATYNKLVTEFKPNKPLNAQYHLDKLTNLNSVDGRGWATYRAEFENSIEQLEGMNQYVPIANILNLITRTLRHPNLQSDVHDLIMTMKTDTENLANAGVALPAIPRWRTTFMNCSTIIGTSPHWDILMTNVDKNKIKENVTLKANVVISDSACIRCGREGHRAKDCYSTRCSICRIAILDQAKHNASKCVPATLSQGGGRPQGGARGRGGGRYGDRGGRFDRSNGRGNRGGRGDGRSAGRSYYEPQITGRESSSSSEMKREREIEDTANDATVYMAAKIASAMWSQMDENKKSSGHSSKDVEDISTENDEEFMRAALLVKKRKFDNLKN